MKLVILDRDGVINAENERFIASPNEWIALPGSLEAIARLTQANWQVVVASNQSGLANNLLDMHALTAIHTKFRHALAALGGRVDAIFICPHRANDSCTCRKPLPGMYHKIACQYNMKLVGVPAVGDSLRDLQACATVGCAPWLVQTGKGTKTLTQGGLPEGTRIAPDLSAVVDALLL